ncbi:luciferase [Arthrobacter sp. Hiyo8]|nr:luciferase [Arthrobacter sp. Hiyo8]
MQMHLFWDRLLAEPGHQIGQAERHIMEIGVFSVSDITTDPTTGHTPTENERIKAAVAIAKKVEEIGMDVYAIGEHHNRPSSHRPPPPRWRTSQRRLNASRCQRPPR